MNDAHTERSDNDRPGRSADDLPAILDRELSRADRLRYLTVGLASLVVTAVTGSLWATEPSLPLRTHLAFAGIVALGIAWMAVAGYVLTRRRPLYAADRVLATGLAVVATSVVGIATTGLVVVRAGALPALTAGAVNIALLAAAAILHVRARRRRDELLSRRLRLANET